MTMTRFDVIVSVLNFLATVLLAVSFLVTAADSARWHAAFDKSERVNDVTMSLLTKKQKWQLAVKVEALNKVKE